MLAREICKNSENRKLGEKKGERRNEREGVEGKEGEREGKETSYKF